MEEPVLPQLLIVLLSGFCLIIILLGFHAVLQKTGMEYYQKNLLFAKSVLVCMTWVGLVGVLALNGFFKDLSSFPPRPIVTILVPFLFFLVLAFSKKGTKMIRFIPPHWLIGMQAFRILVELLLWKAFMVNLLPVQMTFDILSGLLAIPVAWQIKRKWSKSLVIGYNILGLLLLLNILTIAVLSLPTKMRVFLNEPSDIIVGSFPFIYLPSVLVVIALGLHIFSLRQAMVLHREKVPTNSAY
jgi:hypothetical protein